MLDYIGCGWTVHVPTIPVIGDTIIPDLPEEFDENNYIVTNRTMFATRESFNNHLLEITIKPIE